MFDGYEAVKLKINVLYFNLKMGDRGVVVMIYNEPNRVYEVEFLDQKGNTVALLTLREEYLEKV